MLEHEFDHAHNRTGLDHSKLIALVLLVNNYDISQQSTVPLRHSLDQSIEIVTLPEFSQYRSVARMHVELQLYINKILVFKLHGRLLGKTEEVLYNDWDCWGCNIYEKLKRHQVKYVNDLVDEAIRQHACFLDSTFIGNNKYSKTSMQAFGQKTSFFGKKYVE